MAHFVNMLVILTALQSLPTITCAEATGDTYFTLNGEQGLRGDKVLAMM